jgi:thioesterase domain-containing protein
MSTELWDHVAAGAEDDVVAGGWKSAFTGLPLSAEAMAGGTHGQMLTPGVVDQLATHVRRHLDRIGA